MTRKYLQFGMYQIQIKAFICNGDQKERQYYILVEQIIDFLINSW